MSANATDERRRRALARLVVARASIHAAYEIAEYGDRNIKDVKDPRRIALQEALVVAYARPFTQNDGFGALPAAWSRFTDPQMQRRHDNAIELRHKIVAHSDVNEIRILVYPPGVPGPIDSVARSDGAGVAIVTERPMPLWFRGMELLCQDLGTRLNRVAEQELQTLFGSISGAQTPIDLLTGEPADPPL
jgi:hypothetical protein